MNEGQDEYPAGDEMVRAALQGDENAFRQLYNLMYGTLGAVVFRTLDRRTLMKTAASDLIQDAFVKVWERKDELREQIRNQSLIAFQKWLITTVKNQACDTYGYWRREIRDVDREQQVDQGSDGVLPLCDEEPSSTPERRIEAVWDALNQLLPAQREAIRLQKFEGYSRADIATHLNRSEKSVQGLLKRGKCHLANILRGLNSGSGHG